MLHSVALLVLVALRISAVFSRLSVSSSSPRDKTKEAQSWMETLQFRRETKEAESWHKEFKCIH